MLSALASVFKVGDKESQLNEEDILKIMSQVKDPLGTFYSYTLPKSIIKRVVKERGQGRRRRRKT